MRHCNLSYEGHLNLAHADSNCIHLILPPATAPRLHNNTYHTFQQYYYTYMTIVHYTEGGTIP